MLMIKLKKLTKKIRKLPRFKKITALITIFALVFGVWGIAQLFDERENVDLPQIQTLAFAPATENLGEFDFELGIIDDSQIGIIIGGETPVRDRNPDRVPAPPGGWFQGGEATVHYTMFRSSAGSWYYVHAILRAGRIPIPAGTYGLMTLWAGDEAIRTNNAQITRITTEIPPGGVITFRMLLTSEETERIAGRPVNMGFSFLEQNNSRFSSVRRDDALSNRIRMTRESNWIDNASRGFAGGSGTAYNPFLISTPEQLAFLAKTVNAGNFFENQYIRVAQPIKLSGRMWTPIGTLENPFSGNFDGGMAHIHNLTISTREETPQGLFGVTRGGSIIDTGVQDAYVFGHENVGAIVGLNLGTNIEHVFAHGQVKGWRGVGGLIGNNAGRLFRSETHAIVVGVNDIGGIVGRTQENSNIDHITFFGNISGLANSGGAIGNVDGGSFSHLFMRGTMATNGVIAGRINSCARFENISYTVSADIMPFVGAIMSGVQPEFINTSYIVTEDMSLAHTMTTNQIRGERVYITGVDMATRITERAIENIMQQTIGAGTTSIVGGVTVDTRIRQNDVYREYLVRGQTLTVHTDIVNTSGAPINPMLMIAKYNNGRFIGVETITTTAIPSNGVVRRITAPDYVIPSSSVDEIRVIIVDEVTMRPYANVAVLRSSPGVDIFGNTPATAQQIDITRSVSGRINGAGDRDYFRFTVPETGEYIIAIHSQQTVAGRLYNSYRNLLHQNTVVASRGTTYLIGSFTAGSMNYIGILGSANATYTINIFRPTYRTTNLILDTRRNGTITSSTPYVRYTFVAPTAGTYVFTSVGNTEVRGILHSRTVPTVAPVINDTRQALDVSFRLQRTMAAGETVSLIITPKPNVPLGQYSLFVERQLTVTVN